MTNPALSALICRVAIAFVWLYHGLVPKLLGPHPDELAMNLALGISVEAATRVSYVAGGFELLLGLAILALPRQRWPLQLTIVLMLALLAYAAWAVPRLLVGAFNPVTINLCVAALAWLALLQMPAQSTIDHERHIAR